jgi:hypothetical protein
MHFACGAHDAAKCDFFAGMRNGKSLQRDQSCSELPSGHAKHWQRAFCCSCDSPPAPASSLSAPRQFHVPIEQALGYQGDLWQRTVLYLDTPRERANNLFSLYYAQTLVGPISAATGLSASAAGLVVTLTQIGHALGLLFIVPLGDLLENRRLVFVALLCTAAALALAALS